MTIPWPVIAGWYHAALLAALPWCAWWAPRWAPLVAVGAALVHHRVRRSTIGEPWTSLVVVAACAAFLTLTGGWSGPVGLWLALAAAVAITARQLPLESGGRPDAADLLALVGWAAVFAVQPKLLETAAGGWLAPAVLLAAGRRLGTVLPGATAAGASSLGPPTREVRGTLSLRGVVVASAGLPSTVPVTLDLRAGESMAVLCDDPAAAQGFADVLAGRAAPHQGEILIDGSPFEAGDRLVAVVAPGEPFVEGSIDDNLGALRDEPPDRAARGAARDACGLAEAMDESAGRPLAVDGAPLSIYHRLLVLAARALVSHYRVVVVVDPSPWVDNRRRDVWRAALVRASVGRTSIWITADPELADRAAYVHELRGGALRSS